MKKTILGFLLTATIFAVAALPAMANGAFDALYTVDGSGSTTAKSVFDWNETPWLYLRLPSPGLQVTGSWWSDPNSTYYFDSSGPETNQDVWHSLSDWNSVKKTGTWNIDAFYSYAGGKNCGSGNTSFTVTPEPLSSTLLLVGGTALAARRYFRSRRQKKG